MTITYFNETAVRTPGGAATTAGSIILQGASLLWGIASVLPAAMGRRRRHAPGSPQSFSHQEEEGSLVRDVLFKVLDDLDSPSCLPLALCHATSLPESLQTPDHRAIVSLLSPIPAFPVAWPDITKPAAKYQYAAFLGQWAGSSGVPEQCRRVFPTCSLSGADVINLVASWKLPCKDEEMGNKIEQ
ncbi:hypothetical protein O3P69_010051 [Scylla paramamosain]|uniref:Uncharacterized protein n=1 Tax=Scylla paramamosain TaxID=85552 RepID=A0AAW0SN87_SCYPA